MQKVRFNLLPFVNYNNMTDVKILELKNIFDEIKDNQDEIFVPDEFYLWEDESGQTFFEYISEVSNSSAQLLMLTVYQTPSIDVKYEDLYMKTLDEFEGYVAQEKSKAPQNIQDYVVCESHDLQKAYRDFSKRLNSYEEYYLWRKRCFPKLLFTKDTFDKSEQIGTLESNIDEMTECLGCLNDVGRDIYNKHAEQEALAMLQASCGIVCTGKGANETSTFKKAVELIGSDGKYTYNISCIPHFKLESKHSDKRIYFSWGQEQISNHAIIVVHIGPHWSLQNETASEIEGAEYTPIK